MEMKPPLFIIGCARSGTTALMRYHCHTNKTDLCLKEWEKLWREGVNTEECYKHIIIRHNVNKEKRKFNRIVDKNPRHAFRLKEMAEKFPDAEFLHIIRDGRAAALSLRRHMNRQQRRGVANSWYHKFDTTETAAVLWVYWVNTILENKKYLKNYREVRYEDLCEKHKYFTSRNYKWKKVLKPGEKRRVEFLQKPLLKKLNYI